MPKTVLITGTSSGIGRTAVEYFSEQGWNVIATMRKPSSDAGQQFAQLNNVMVVALDVTNEASIKDAVKAGLDKFGAIDVLVNNAGFGLSGPLELATPAQLDLQFKTNLIGPILVMQAVLPTMRAVKSGLIINVSSVVGRVPIPLNSLYVGSKFGLEGVSEAAAIELAPFGIKVRLVEPGGVRTDFSGRSMLVTQSDTVHDYDALSKRMVAKLGELVQGGSESIDIAKKIFEAAIDTSDKIRFPVGKDALQMLSERVAVSDEEYQKVVTERFNVRL